MAHIINLTRQRSANSPERRHGTTTNTAASESQKEERGGRREEEGSGMVRENQEGGEEGEQRERRVKTTQQMSGKNRCKSDMQGQAKVDITCGKCQKREAKSNNFHLIKVFQNKKGNDLSQKQGSKSQRGKEAAIRMEVFLWV